MSGETISLSSVYCLFKLLFCSSLRYYKTLRSIFSASNNQFCCTYYVFFISNKSTINQVSSRYINQPEVDSPLHPRPHELAPDANKFCTVFVPESVFRFSRCVGGPFDSSPSAISVDTVTLYPITRSNAWGCDSFSLSPCRPPLLPPCAAQGKTATVAAIPDTHATLSFLHTPFMALYLSRPLFSTAYKEIGIAKEWSCSNCKFMSSNLA